MIPPYPLILKLAWRQYINRFDIILFGHLLFSLPLLIAAAAWKEYFPLVSTIATLADLWPNFFIQVGIDHLASLLACLVSIMVVIAMQRATKQQATDFLIILKQSLPFYLPVLLILVIEFVLTLLGFSLLILPGIMVVVGFIFVLPAMVWHQLTPWAALRYSLKLVRHHFWTLLLYVIMVQLLITATTLFITWGFPVNFYFNIIAAWITTICASFYTVFITILLNAVDMEKLPKPLSV